MEVRSTQDGVLRAFGMLLQQASNRRPVKEKFTYESNGSAIHAARCLRQHEADAVDAIVDQLKLLDAKDDANKARVQSLLRELSKQPVRFVPVKRQIRIDHSKSYPYGSKRQGY